MSVFTTKNIDEQVQTALFRKLAALDRGVYNKDGETISRALSETKDNAIGQQLVRSVFVRVQADVVADDKLDDVKREDLLCEQLAGYMEGNITDNTVKQGLRPISFNKSPFNNDKNYIWRGQSGITGVEIQQQSFFVKKITINWTCPDPVEFEDRWLKKFLKHGRFMVVEFGWGISQDKVKDLLKDGEDLDTIGKLIEIKKRRNKAYAGSYQLETGVVSEYNYEMTSFGGYSGTITLISRGHSLLKKPITSGESKTNPPRLYSKSETPEYTNSANRDKREEEKRKFIEAEATFKEVIDKLDKVVEKYTGASYNIDDNTLGGGESNTIDIADTPEDLKYYYRTGAVKFIRAGKYPFGPRYFVTWGWFEDFILNSFFRVSGKDKSGNELILQEFRSVHRETDEEQEKRKATAFENTEDIQEKIIIPNFCNNTINLDSLGSGKVILPGQFDINNTIEEAVMGLEELDKFIVKSSKKVKEGIYQYRTLKEIKNFINDVKRFKPFGDKDERYGIIRNMLFDIEYLQQGFSDVTSVQEGIKNFWEMVESDYGKFFNFQIQVDYANNGRVMITDHYYQNQYDKIQDSDDPEKENTVDTFVEQGVIAENSFVFNLNSKNSIIKEFSLDLKLSAEAASLAAYGNYKKSKKGSLTSAGTTKDLSIERFVSLFAKEETPSETENKTKSQQGLVDGGSTDTGNKQKDENSVVNKTISDLTIQTEELGIGYFSALEGSPGNEVSELKKDGGIEFRVIDGIKDNVEKIFEEIDAENAEVDDEGLSEEDKKKLKEINLKVDYNLNGERKELATETTLEKINTSPVRTDMSNWQMLNVVIPIELSMTIDGVGGLEPGDVFRVDYLPELYRKYAFFQIFTINHSISQGGWDTKITAKMRLNTEKMIKDGLIVLVEPEKEDQDDQRTAEQVETQEKIKETIEYIEEKEDSNLVALGRDGFSNDLALPSAKGGQYWTEKEIEKINEFIKSGEFTRGQAIAQVRAFQWARPYG
jgi:hypothetical protein